MFNKELGENRLPMRAFMKMHPDLFKKVSKIHWKAVSWAAWISALKKGIPSAF